MRSYLFVGDTHGDLGFTVRAFDLASEHDAEIIQVGDWGFIWDRSNQLEALSLRARAQPPVTMRFIDGNHDHHTALRALVPQDSRTGASPGGVEIAPHVIYQPRGSTYVDEDGTRFLFVGGAPSIDWMTRIPGQSIWTEEEHISEVEYENALAIEGPVHVLVTHDAPDYPPGFVPSGDPDYRVRSARSMEMVAGLIARHQPELHVHGHWHTRYSMRHGSTRVEGLHCNNARYLSDAVMLWSRRPLRFPPTNL